MNRIPLFVAGAAMLTLVGAATAGNAWAMPLLFTALTLASSAAGMSIGLSVRSFCSWWESRRPAAYGRTVVHMGSGNLADFRGFCGTDMVRVKYWGSRFTRLVPADDIEFLGFPPDQEVPR